MNIPCAFLSVTPGTNISGCSIIIRRIFALITLSFTFLFGQVDYNMESKGYSKIKVIGISINKNPVLSQGNFERIVKAVAYKTLPNSVALDLKEYLRIEGYRQDHIGEFDSLETDFRLLSLLNMITLDILAVESGQTNKYHAAITIQFLMQARSEMIEIRMNSNYLRFEFIRRLISSGISKEVAEADWIEQREEIVNIWDKELVSYPLLGKQIILSNAYPQKVQDEVRSLVQEIFDDLAIRMRENP